VLLVEKGIERSIDVTTYSFASPAHLVAGTDRLVREAVAYLPIRFPPLPFELQPMRQVMQWHVHRSNDPANLWLREILCAVSVAAG